MSSTRKVFLDGEVSGQRGVEDSMGNSPRTATRKLKVFRSYSVVRTESLEQKMLLMAWMCKEKLQRTTVEGGEVTR